MTGIPDSLLLDAWMAWARGNPKRRVVFLESTREYAYKKWFDDWSDWFDAWRAYSWYDWIATVEPTNYLERGLVSRIFLDIDDRGHAPAIFKSLRSAGIEYWVLDSGRGFHVYIEFEPVRLGRVYREVAKRFLTEILGDAVKYIDGQALRNGSTGRPPFTMNTGAGKRVCLYESRRCWEDGYEPPLNGKWLTEMLYDYASVLEYEAGVDVEKIAPNYFTGKSLRDYPKCIQSMIRRLIEEGELEHMARVHLASFLLRLGIDVHSVFRHANDYREWRTQYHADYIRRGRYVTLSCRRVAEMGYCPFFDKGGVEGMKRCPFYPWVEKWLPAWR